MSDTLYDSAKARFESAVTRAYPIGAVPAQPSYPYLVWSVTQDDAVAYGLDAKPGAQFHRVTWQAFGKTLASVRDYDRRATVAFLGVPLLAAGFTCDPPTDGYGGILGRLVRDPDDAGLLGITSTLTFIATEE